MKGTEKNPWHVQGGSLSLLRGRTNSRDLRCMRGGSCVRQTSKQQLQEGPMSFMSYGASKSEDHDQADAFAEGFKQWLVDSVAQWSREHPHEARGLERAVGQLRSVLMAAAREAAPVLEVLAADGLASRFKHQYQESGIAIERGRAVRLAFGLMAFRLPYTAEDWPADGGIATMRDYELLAARALMDESLLPALIDGSRSNPIAFRALQRAVHQLRHSKTPMPDVLSEWAHDVADGTQVCPRAKPGRSPYTNKVRDDLIVGTVQALVDCGLRATRNEASEPTSACDAVSGALVAHGVDLSYEAVAKVWNKRQGRHPALRLRNADRTFRPAQRPM